MPIAGSPPRLSTHPDRFLAVFHPPSRSALTSNPHGARCPAEAELPATSCLGAFWTLSAQRAETLVIAGVQKPAHKDAFPRPRLRGRCRFSQRTFTRTRSNGRDAPIPDLPALTPERGSSTQSGPFGATAAVVRGQPAIRCLRGVGFSLDFNGSCAALSDCFTNVAEIWRPSRSETNA